MSKKHAFFNMSLLKWTKIPMLQYYANNGACVIRIWFDSNNTWTTTLIANLWVLLPSRN